jgi:hypothetical protein
MFVPASVTTKATLPVKASSNPSRVAMVAAKRRAAPI